MAVVRNPDSAYEKELARWERNSLDCPTRPGRIWRADDPLNRFPKMLLMAHRNSTGIASFGDPNNEAFAQKCQKIVHNEAEESIAVGQGWREKPQEALDLLHREEQRISTAAAHRAYEDRNLGEVARHEMELAEAATSDHLAEIPQAPVKRRGRPRKVQTVTEN